MLVAAVEPSIQIISERDKPEHVSSLNQIKFFIIWHINIDAQFNGIQRIYQLCFDKQFLECKL